MLSSEKVVEYAGTIDYNNLPESSINSSHKVLIDSIGCCIGALSSPPVEKLKKLYSSSDSIKNATLIGCGSEVPVEYAALINGVMVRYLDYNDDFKGPYGACHPSDQIPALLAVAEAEESSGKELIEAMITGYEIQCQGVMTGKIRQHGWDYVSWGAQGATAAIGKLMDLSKEEQLNALGISVSSMHALKIVRRGEISMWKGIAQAFAIHNAVQACYMAKEGITGPKRVYDGDYGFNQVMVKEEFGFNQLEKSESSYMIDKSNIKFYPACYSASSCIEATIQLVEQNDIRATDVNEIKVKTYNKACETVATKEKWSTNLNRETADHSLPYLISLGILEEDITINHYEPIWLHNNKVHQIMNKVSVESCQQMDSYKMRNPYSIPASVKITTSDDVFEYRVNYPKGHWKNPMSKNQIENKTKKLAGDHFDAQYIDSIIEGIYNISSIDNVSTLIPTYN